jgi:hypothetical protein
MKKAQMVVHLRFESRLKNYAYAAAIEPERDSGTNDRKKFDSDIETIAISGATTGVALAAPPSGDSSRTCSYLSGFDVQKSQISSG